MGIQCVKHNVHFLHPRREANWLWWQFLKVLTFWLPHSACTSTPFRLTWRIIGESMREWRSDVTGVRLVKRKKEPGDIWSMWNWTQMVWMSRWCMAPILQCFLEKSVQITVHMWQLLRAFGSASYCYQVSTSLFATFKKNRAASWIGDLKGRKSIAFLQVICDTHNKANMGVLRAHITTRN